MIKAFSCQHEQRPGLAYGADSQGSQPPAMPWKPNVKFVLTRRYDLRSRMTLGSPYRMKRSAFNPFIVALLVIVTCVPMTGTALETNPTHLRLWYDKPATQWVEALPIGNGRLGAMVFGGVGIERLQLNEDTLWAGGPYNPANPSARNALPRIRQLLADGEFRQAQDLVDAQFMAVPLRQMPYQTLGDLLITMSSNDIAVDYVRELDLETATARTSFGLGGVQHSREYFVSPVDQVIADPNPDDPSLAGNDVDAITDEATPMPIEDADPNAVVPQDALIPPAPIDEAPAQ